MAMFMKDCGLKMNDTAKELCSTIIRTNTWAIGKMVNVAVRADIPLLMGRIMMVHGKTI